MTPRPVSRPTVRCVPRLTSCGSLGPGAACADSKSIAAWTGGSPSAYATGNASRPAARPTSMPRTSSERITLMAGEAEQVPAVVHELVDARARDERGDALFGADEVDEDEEHEPR